MSKFIFDKLTNYFHTSRTPQKCINYLTKLNKGQKIKYDHMAFRSIYQDKFLNIIDQVENAGYKNMKDLIDIPVKNDLDARKFAHWFKNEGELIPRVFLSFGIMTDEQRAIINSKLNDNIKLHKLKENGDDYISWTHLYDDEINHVAVDLSHIEDFENFIYKMANDLNLEMNDSQGLFQVSADKKLIQCSTKSDYWNGERKNYIEFVKRIDGRDGFEGKNAYGIFQSTK